MASERRRGQKRWEGPVSTKKVRQKETKALWARIKKNIE